MNIFSATKTNTDPGTYEKLGRYRYKIFVKKMGWDLPALTDADDKEFDQFDNADTLYIIAEDSKSDIYGCARLLPTTSDYLLNTVFSQLCDNRPPSDHFTWELSRFAASTSQDQNLAMSIFWYGLEKAWLLGAESVVAVTTTALERYFSTKGVILKRLGAPTTINGEKLIALEFPTCQTNIAANTSARSA